MGKHKKLSCKISKEGRAELSPQHSIDIDSEQDGVLWRHRYIGILIYDEEYDKPRQVRVISASNQSLIKSWARKESINATLIIQTEADGCVFATCDGLPTYHENHTIKAYRIVPLTRKVLEKREAKLRAIRQAEELERQAEKLERKKELDRNFELHLSQLRSEPCFSETNLSLLGQFMRMRR